MLAKMTSKNQITIPAAVAKKFRGTYFDVRTDEESIILTPVSTTSSEAVREKLKQLKIKEKTIADAVEWARR